MNYEGLPGQAPAQVIDNPPITIPPTEIPVGVPVVSNQAHPVPRSETIPPATAEKTHGVTKDSAYAQVRGWAGHVDVNASAKQIIERINVIRAKGGQPLIDESEENIALIELAQLKERNNIAEAAETKLKEAVNAPKVEEPPEETRSQIQDKINDNWDKAGTLIVAEADANVWDEKATGISDGERAIRVAARRWRCYINAEKAYIQKAIDDENNTRKNGGQATLTAEEVNARRQKLHKEINDDPSILQTEQFRYDKDAETFIVYAPNGKTETERFSPVELVEPTRTFLHDLSNRKDVGGKPVPSAGEAQVVKDVLYKYYVKDRGFPARTESELQAEKRDAFVKGNVEDEIVEHIKRAKTENGKSLIEVDGATGKITTLHEELLKDMVLDEALISDETLLGLYLSLDKPSDQAAKENLMAQLYRRLAQKNPDLFKDGPDMKVLTARMDAVDKKILKWLDDIDPNHRHAIPKSFENNPVALLTFISAIRRGGLVEQTPRGPQLSERGKEFFEKLKGSKRIEPEDTSFILTIATDQNADYADSFLSQEFGISAETISDPKQMKRYVDLVMRDMESSGKITKEEMAICRKISETQMSDVNFARLAKKFGLPPWAGVVFMFALVGMPLFQQTADDDGAKGGGGGGGAPQ